MSEMFYEDFTSETLEMDRETTEMMDMYENSDAVRNDKVMINNTLQHTGRVSVKNRKHRSVQVCLCLLSVLLFTAVIVICVYFNERNQLIRHNYRLTKEREELYSWLTKQDQRFYNFKWIYYNLSFYYISSEGRSRNESRRDCEQRGADLVIINNKEEQEFLLKATAGQYWIGLSKELEVWKWVDDTKLALSFWINRHPRHSETCAATSSSGWVSYSCDRNQRWICEKRILQSLII
ncbi:C-type lectin domain family 2 member B-like [Paramisgurnus dabryanus]|uniref:C-type lectin domain family 2 member B-like n=1 Tax=Paramisgurnus dabryanus TaxID=90735 RepID=UPI0031F3FB42